ncbi:hypothetical protein [Methanosalsum natronophilum]|nr:hypothetical protein [Methanosalsum natronophilum]MCS3923974.1 nickel transport protein [Methanosalsum natronophilum]
MNRFNILCTFLFISIFIIGFVTPVSGHAVYMDVTQNVEIEVFGYHSETDIFSNENIVVYAIDENGEELLYIEDTLDEDGLYTFTPKDGYEEYRIKIYDDWGHQEEATINVKEGGTSPGSSQLSTPIAVFAGFGYLIGLAGVGMLISARRKNN